jgi:hypothetical protein
MKSDRYFKWFLFAVAMYFLIHIGIAAAQQAPIVQCWVNGFGTIQCIQI